MTREFAAAENVHKRYGGVIALNGVSVRLNAGEIHCLAGENGNGKSTLIKILSGAVSPDRGEIRAGGRTAGRLAPLAAMRLGIHAIHQDLSLFPNLTLAENIAIPGQVERGRFWMNWRETRIVAERAAARLGAELDLDKPAGEVPVAQRQLAAIARALDRGARLLILDEPTTALAPRETCALFAILKRLRDEGTAILFVSHKLPEIMEIAGRITILRNGAVAAEGPAAEFDARRIAREMTGRALGEGGRAEPPDLKGGPVIKAENLALAGAYRDVSLELRAGEVLGMTGLLGSGADDIARTLFGLVRPGSGRICLDGKPVKIDSPLDAVRLGIAFVPEDRLAEGLFADLSVERNAIAARMNRERGGWFGPPPGALSRMAREWIARMGVKMASPLAPVSSLSGGNQQKVVLAKWLMAEARVLILCGPTVGVDIGAKREIHNRIAELAREGAAVLVVSGDLPELLHVCRRILVVREGRVAEEWDARDLDENRLTERMGAARV